MALQGTLTVTTEELRTQSIVVRDKLNQMQEYFEDLKNLFSRTSGYWTGEAGDAHRESYSSRIGRIEEMLRRYQEHVTDLQVMAGVYEDAEIRAMNAADSLPASTLD